MAIHIDKEKLLFHLQGSNTSYVMQVIRDGYLAHLYWGKKIQNYRGSNKIIFMDRGFSPNPDGEDRAFSLDTIPQEYPSFGKSDFRIPAYQLQLENGSTVTDFRYKEHRVYQGKPKLKGLPSTYAEDAGEVETLEIVLEDPLIDVKIVLSYSLYQKRDVITRSVRFDNEGRQQLKLLRALSASVDFRDDEYELITLYGAHNNEKI